LEMAITFGDGICCDFSIEANIKIAVNGEPISCRRQWNFRGVIQETFRQLVEAHAKTYRHLPGHLLEHLPRHLPEHYPQDVDSNAAAIVGGAMIGQGIDCCLCFVLLLRRLCSS
jgi:hypothetical protein